MLLIGSRASVNPAKFQAVIKKNRKMANVITFDNQKVEPASPVRVLPGIQLDDKLSFNLHDSNICQSARNCL